MATITPQQLHYFETHSKDNRQGELYATAICTIILTWLSVALRFLSRWKTRAGFKADDWLIVLAATSFTAFPVGIFVLVSVGFGTHIIFVTDPQKMVEMVVLCEIAYSITILITKMSILSFYNRLFPSQKLQRASMVIAAITVVYSMALAVVCILQCIPLSTLWDGNPDGWCMDTKPPYTATAVANVVTDIAILCLPMPFLYRLNMRASRKIQLMAIFALGGCVVVFGVVRSIEVGTASYVDQSWSTVNGTIWSAVEPCVGIISACLPTMRGLLRREREPHTGYTDYEPEGGPGGRSLAARFGWVPPAYPGGRRKSLHSSIVLSRGSSNKPQVWSTVTSGLQSATERTERGKLEQELEEYPFTRLDGDGRTAETGSRKMHETSLGRLTPLGRRGSVNDIHVKTEMTQEVSRTPDQLGDR